MTSPENKTTFLRTELLKHLEGGMAYMPLPKMIAEIPYDKLGERPYDLPYSFYELFYHIVFAQEDILRFISAENYHTPNWPQDYWPKRSGPENKKEWKALQTSYHKNYNSLKDFLSTDKPSFDQPVKHSTDQDQTLLREVLLIITHTAYHTGQLLVLLRLLNLHQ